MFGKNWSGTRGLELETAIGEMSEESETLVETEKEAKRQ